MWYKKRKFVIYIIFGILLLIALFAFKKYIYIQEPFYKPDVVVRNNLNQHILKKYGYSFLYADDYILQSSARGEPKPPEDDRFGFHRNRKGEPILNTTIDVWNIGYRDKQQSLLEFAKRYFENWLSYKNIPQKFAPPVSGRVVNTKNYPFVAPYGIMGHEFYFTIEETEKGNITHKSRHRKGPYLVFELPNSLNSSLVVFIVTSFGDTLEGRDAITLFLNSLQPLKAEK